MNLTHIVFKNIAGNFKAYRTYFFATSFSVMVFFVFAMLIYHPSLNMGSMRETVQQAGKAVEIIIFVFLSFFISYAIMSYARQRSKDYAMFKILGATSGQLMRIYFFENLIIFAGAILSGILMGMLFSKFFFMVLARVLEVNVLDFYFASKALLLTVSAFMALFILVNFFSMFLLNRIKLSDILQFGRKAQKLPKVRWLWALVGIGMMATGYYLAYTCTPTTIQDRFFPIILIVIIGTLLFYWQSVVWLILLLKRNKSFYLRGINILWISDLAYRVKSLTVVLFFSTIVIAIGLTAISSVYSFLYSSKENLVANNEYELVIGTTVDDEAGFVDKAKIILNQLEENYQITTLEALSVNVDGNKSIFVLKKSDIESCGLTHSKFSALKNWGEGAMLFPEGMVSRKKNRKKLIGQTRKLGNQNILVRDSLIDSFANAMGYKVFFVVGDSSYQELSKTRSPLRLHVFNYSNILAGSRALLVLKDDYLKKMSAPYFFLAPGAQYQRVKVGMRFTLFLCLFVGGIFFVSAGSMLYFNFYNHLQSEKEKYGNIAKIGLSSQEIIRSSRIQMAILFFLPNLFAILHTAFALKTLSNLNKINIMFPVLMVLLAMFVLQLIYFFVINRQYNKHLMANINCL